MLKKNHDMYAGMKCGGCVGHVKSLLEALSSVKQVEILSSTDSSPSLTSAPQLQATVNLTTETALVRVMVPKGSRSNGAILSPFVLDLAEKMAQVGKVLSWSSVSLLLLVHSYIIASRQLNFQKHAITLT